jgi:hypothetical protein
MSFHPAPFGEISTRVKDPQDFINQLYRQLNDARIYFPGETNYTGACIDCVLEQLEAIGATTDFNDEILDGDSASHVDFARAVLARYGTHPVPVPVAEDAALQRVAMIAHAGGLIGYSNELEAMNEIRRLSSPWLGDQVNKAQRRPLPLPQEGQP